MTPEQLCDLDNEAVNARVTYHHALKRVYDAAVDHHGKIYRPIPGRYEAEHAHQPLDIPMSFSRALLDLVGGLQMLDHFWEVDTDHKTEAEAWSVKDSLPGGPERYRR